MKNILSVFILLFSFIGSVSSQGLKVGDKAIDFNLKNIDGKMVSMKDYLAAKGLIVIFTCNHCPFSIAYQDRIIDIEKKYKSMGFEVVAINPNDAKEYPDDNFENMKKRAKEKSFNFPYLVDESQSIAKGYGATRTPHVFVIDRLKGNTISYIGAIDDNSDDASQVKEKYLENALNSILKSQQPKPDFTKAIGCGIKWKKA